MKNFMNRFSEVLSELDSKAGEEINCDPMGQAISCFMVFCVVYLYRIKDSFINGLTKHKEANI